MKKLSIALAIVLVAALALAIVLVATVTTHAANLTGTWNVKLDLGGEGDTAEFRLKQEGDKITGVIGAGHGAALVTGRVKGSDVTIDVEGEGAKIHFAGRLNADGTQIEGTCDWGDHGSGTFTATKQAEEK